MRRSFDARRVQNISSDCMFDSTHGPCDPLDWRGVDSADTIHCPSWSTNIPMSHVMARPSSGTNGKATATTITGRSIIDGYIARERRCGGIAMVGALCDAVPMR